MRHARAKAARKTLQFFERTVGIHVPYQILVDGTFIVAFLKSNLPLSERLAAVLQQQALHICIAESSLRELEQLQEHARNDVEKCNVLREAHKWAKKHCAKILLNIPTLEGSPPNFVNDTGKQHVQLAYQGSLSPAGRDMVALVSHNKSSDAPSYFLASQDDVLLDVARQLGGVPILRLARASVLLLEQPSAASTRQAQRDEEQKWRGGGGSTATAAASVTSAATAEQTLMQLAWQHVRSKEDGEQHASQYQRKKTKAKGPNPLSCKSSQRNKRAAPGPDGESDDGKVRVATEPRRKRRRRSKASDSERVPS